mgnify:CR=1 FL=1
MPGTILSALRNEPPVIRSDGRFVRDYIFVGDAVAAYLLAAARAGEAGIAGEAFNISTGSRVPVLAAVKLVLALAGRRRLKPVIENRQLKEIREQTLDSTKARRVLGWRPRYDLRRGLKETIPWYRNLLKEWTPSRKSQGLSKSP